MKVKELMTELEKHNGEDTITIISLVDMCIPPKKEQHCVDIAPRITITKHPVFNCLDLNLERSK